MRSFRNGKANVTWRQMPSTMTHTAKQTPNINDLITAFNHPLILRGMAAIASFISALSISAKWKPRRWQLAMASVHDISVSSNMKQESPNQSKQFTPRTQKRPHKLDIQSLAPSIRMSASASYLRAGCCILLVAVHGSHLRICLPTRMRIVRDYLQHVCELLLSDISGIVTN